MYFPNYWDGSLVTPQTFIVALDQRAQVRIQRLLCDATKTSTPATKTLPDFTILSYRDVGTSALPLFTSKALFVAGKGRFGFTKIGPQKCEGPRNFPIVWFLQLDFSRRLEWPGREARGLPVNYTRTLQTTARRQGQGRLHTASPLGAAAVRVPVGHTTPAHSSQQACLLISPLSGTSLFLYFLPVSI